MAIVKPRLKESDKLTNEEVVKTEKKENEHIAVPSKRMALDISVEEKFKASDEKVKDVDVNLIKNRKENNFIMSGIRKLAENIEKNGQLQSIIVREEIGKAGKREIICVVGHRRLAAMKLLNRESGGEKFKTIKARFLTDSEKENEEAIYRDSNAQSRDVTAYEILLNYNVKGFDPNSSEETRKKYLETLFTEKEISAIKDGNFLDGKSILSNEMKARYFTRLISEEYPTISISDESARKYIKVIETQTEKLKQCILCGAVSLRDGVYLAAKDPAQQEKILKNVDPTDEKYQAGEKANISVESLKNAAKYYENKKEKRKAGEFGTITKNLEKATIQLRAINKDFEELDEANLSPNKREYIAKYKEVLSQLEKVLKLPQ